MWIFKFSLDEIKVGFLDPDGRMYSPITFKSEELEEAMRLVNYLNGGKGSDIPVTISEGQQA